MENLDTQNNPHDAEAPAAEEALPTPRTRGNLPLSEILQRAHEQSAGNEPEDGDEVPEDGRKPQNEGGDAEPEKQEKPQRSEVDRLRHELASAVGRLKPTQQRLEQAQRENANLQHQLSVAQSRIEQLEAEYESVSELRKEQKARDLVASLSERFPSLDPEYLEAMATAMKEADTAAVQKRDIAPPQFHAEPEVQAGHAPNQAAKIKLLLNHPSRNIGSLPALAQDPQFGDWVNSRPDVSADIMAFTQATSESDVDELATRIDAHLDEYFASSEGDVDSTPTATPVKNTSGVAQHIKRGNTPKISRREYEARRQEILSRVRSRDPAVREKASKDLDKLQSQFYR